MAFPFWIIPTIASALFGLGSRGGGGNSGGASGGANGISLDALGPQLEQLLAAQKRQALFTDPGAYASMGLTEADIPEGAVPLQGAVARMAFGMLPRYARSGFGGAASGGGGGGGVPEGALRFAGRNNPRSPGLDPTLPVRRNLGTRGREK